MKNICKSKDELRTSITRQAIGRQPLLAALISSSLKYLINIMRQAIYGRKLVMFIISNIVS
jgi:hypothetical protein